MKSGPDRCRAIADKLALRWTYDADVRQRIGDQEFFRRMLKAAADKGRAIGKREAIARLK